MGENDMSENDRLAIAAHLHVLLRRHTGRVTDTEWMAANPEYALAIITFARTHAQSHSVPELPEWAARLEAAWLEEPETRQRVPLAQRAGDMLRQRLEERRYVGRLR